MTTDVDICNRALSECGTRQTISSLTQGTTSANTCQLHYTTLRKQLIRCAPWGFTRKTAPLTLLGQLSLQTCPYPWIFKYAYPADCLKLRYVLNPPPTFAQVGAAPVVGEPAFMGPFSGPCRSNRFIVAMDDTSGQDVKVLLTNVGYDGAGTTQPSGGGIAVYNKDILNPDLWDDAFQNAMVEALKYKIVIPLSGNAGMRTDFKESAEAAIDAARVSDGNEAIPTTDYTPDWIQTRGVDSIWGFAPGFTNYGQWYGGWDSMNWGS